MSYFEPFDFEPLKSPYSGSRAAYHSLIINRIYHEDMLFAQRAYVLLAVHAFLMTAFTVLVAGQHSKLTWVLAGVLGLFGALLGIFQAAFGRQTSRVIGFWREYARLIEVSWDIPFDHLQYNFYAEASAVTPFGLMVKKTPGQKSLYAMFKRTRFLTSIISMLGLFFPSALALFWIFVVSCALYQLSGSYCLGIAALSLLVAAGIFALQPSLAEPCSNKSHPMARPD